MLNLSERSVVKTIGTKRMLIGALLLLGSFVLAYFSREVYHFTVELTISLLFFSTAVITMASSGLTKNLWFSYFGIAFALGSIFQFLHIIFSDRLHLFNEGSRTLSYAFATSESYVMCFAIIVFVLLANRNLNPKKIFYFFILYPLALIVVIVFDIMPNFLFSTSGSFKVANELSVVIVYLSAFVILYKRKASFMGTTVSYMTVAIAAEIISKLYVIIDIEKYAISLVASEYLHFVAVYLLFRVIMMHTMLEPVSLLNKEIYKQNMELLKREEFLQEKEEAYRMVVEKLPIATVLKKDNIIFFANDAAVTLLKARNKEQIIGMSCLDLVHPICHEAVINSINAAKGIDPIIAFSEKLIDFENNIVDVEATTLHINSQQGIFQMVLVTDVTAINKAKAMAKALEAARENERVYTEYLANLSHEFRTPINIIYNSCQLIDIYIESGIKENLEKYNKVIKQNCNRIYKLVDNLIDSSVICEGFYEINSVRVNLVDVIEDTVLSASSYIENHGMEIVFDTDTEEIQTLCDPDKIERIMLNILSNAVKYKREGPGRIEVSIFSREDYIKISIRDDGKGIPEEKLPTIFNRFTRADKSFSRAQEGSGLGLYIAKALVELHEGSITAYSVLNEGSEFVINLPMIRSQRMGVTDRVIKTKSIAEKIEIEFSDVY